MAHNVFGLGEVANLEALTFNSALMFIRIPNVQFSTQPYPYGQVHLACQGRSIDLCEKARYEKASESGRDERVINGLRRFGPECAGILCIAGDSRTSVAVLAQASQPFGRAGGAGSRRRVHGVAGVAGRMRGAGIAGWSTPGAGWPGPAGTGLAAAGTGQAGPCLACRAVSGTFCTAKLRTCARGSTGSTGWCASTWGRTP